MAAVDTATPMRGNRILQRLGAQDFALLQPHLREVELQRGAVIQSFGASIEHVYFPTEGMISLLTLMKNGVAVEFALIGRDGVLGGAIATGIWRPTSQAIVQIAGSALRMTSAHFLEAFRSIQLLRTLVHQYQAMILHSAQQAAACNALHSVEERLCRWLLESRDRTERERVPLTQEFLSQMLGVQRSTVTLAAGILQQAGIIRYSRGQIDILDRKRLEAASCECYEALRGHSRLDLSERSSRDDRDAVS